MYPSEVTAEQIQAIESAVGLPTWQWSGNEATKIIAAAMSLPVAKPATEPELTDAEAYEKFMSLVEAESNEDRLPHMDEVAVGVVRKRHPNLAAQFDRECEKHYQAARVRWSASRVRNPHR